MLMMNTALTPVRRAPLLLAIGLCLLAASPAHALSFGGWVLQQGPNNSGTPPTITHNTPLGAGGSEAFIDLGSLSRARFARVASVTVNATFTADAGGEYINFFSGFNVQLQHAGMAVSAFLDLPTNGPAKSRILTQVTSAVFGSARPFSNGRTLQPSTGTGFNKGYSEFVAGGDHVLTVKILLSTGLFARGRWTTVAPHHLVLFGSPYRFVPAP